MRVGSCIAFFSLPLRVARRIGNPPAFDERPAQMRVLIINTGEKTGGAAVAAKRLTEALNNNGVKAMMLVRDKETDDITVAGLGGVWRRQWHFLWERLCIFFKMRFSRERLFEVDIANAGTDVTTLREFKEADIIHLHWINQGMLSLAGIRKIIATGKPVVWTMHDFWPATAICHYPRDCRSYESRCARCRYLPGGGGDNDTAARVWRRKEQIWRKSDIAFVACSRWLADRAKRSGLLRGKVVMNIPNAIDIRVYHPTDKRRAKSSAALPLDKKIILFVSQRTTDKRKGMEYFVEACERLAAQHGDMTDGTAVAILGGHSEEYVGRLPFETFPLGYVNDDKRIVDVYNAADVYVLPSLEDNLPNTIMEAMACGVPCVGFKTGGIPEMIDHKKNGYVAEYKNSADLADGIAWVLLEADGCKLGADAVSKVVSRYSQQSVAMRYIEVYNQVAAIGRYRL